MLMCYSLETTKIEGKGKIPCPFCGSYSVETREKQQKTHPEVGVFVWRRYRCNECKRSFRTAELYEMTDEST